MARKGTRQVSIGLVSVLFVATALVGIGAFVAVWRRDLTHALAGIPLMFAGAGTAFAGVSLFAAAPTGGSQLLGQEMAALLSVAALAAVTLGVGLAGRVGPR
jgi:NADH:ubiquinone oxidoreductase subunit K